MLTCISCSKQYDGSLHEPVDEDSIGTSNTKQAVKTLTSQIKDMALKASSAYRHCKPCTGSGCHQHDFTDADSASEKFACGYRRTGKEIETRCKGISSSDVTPSFSDRSEPPVLMEFEEQKEWVAQIEPGVHITFVSAPHGGNDLRRIRFSREMFNKWQAQRWWAENYDRVMELYNVQRFNREVVPFPTPLRSEDENSKIESSETSPMTPPLSKERLPRNLHRAMGMGYSSSDSLDHHPMCIKTHNYYDSYDHTPTPQLSSISGAKTETSSMDTSVRTSSSREADHSGELTAFADNASDMETEWVEQDEPGVYITIKVLPDGVRELRRVRFSRERFGEMQARLWWEENRRRIQEQYL